MSHRVVFAPAAEAQLVSLYRYIAQEASADIAERFTTAIIEQCEALATFPHRGTQRDDIRPGLRTIPFRRRVTIAYTVDAVQVSILGLYYGGQDFTAGWTDDDQQQ
ncbi:type II toxin-antitoxin system RelE/ParE family toxin [Novosphingobium sp. FSW06-99]|uniref:type II toxin-antitoxin system RelE/ParE family toxin n=1 Tax=Novosphingobium sp. FSW06-99 TaxID=1739113 RepID=UPI00076C1005|nr:type II toxin-antitoxin system RelE/ParE family toxin [Novosphingobium sp. FSW06-99]KUR77211.1 plasmid stabilization protein [Novosphingobium sp. FSW06-99]